MVMLFYRVYKNKKKGIEEGNCLTVLRDPDSLILTGNYECYETVFFDKNSECCGSSVSPEYLRDKCKKISKEQAYKEHPNLQKYIEN